MNSPSRDHAHTATGATPDGAATNAGSDGERRRQRAEPWSADERAILASMAAEGAKSKDIASAIGKSRSAVIGYASREGIALLYRNPPAAPRTPRKPDSSRTRHGAEVIARVRELWAAGATTSVISADTDVPRGTVSLMVRDLPRRRAITWSTAHRDHAFRVTALAAVLTGESAAKAAKRLGCNDGSIANWKRDAAAVADATALAARIMARWTADKAAAAAQAEAERQAEVARVAALNAPVFAAMPARHRSMMEHRAAGETLQAVGDDFGITRERVRQIEVKWRLRGLVVPGADALSAASIRTFAPRERRPASPAKPALDFYATAHALVARETPKRPYNMSDAERERRRAWGRELGLRRSGAPA